MPGGPPRDFRCPDCGALYKLVRVLKSEAKQLDYQATVLCVHCSRPLPPTDDGFLLKYFMIEKPRDKVELPSPFRKQSGR